ncbi:hypothetical protein HUG10_10290 [Halorarum halophilum]|uniref:DUF7344 domain-containing protein n=1 Tax=Halorarum halophilum TaxID=2743090 RepID=A0A7D5K803_9EURY|nr:hypothetical protein [Halobaculum halophilum]QLG27919.1 hypothetical protein HUG10_10290 [Halobaculum halophilum]
MKDLTIPPEAVSRADDELLGVLADEHCRTVLWYFRYYSTHVATVDALEQFVCEQHGQHAGEAHVAVYLHHSILPKLANAGLVDYDARSRTARYRVDPNVETWLDHVTEHGEPHA